MHALVLIMINMCTKFNMPSFTHSNNMIGPQNFKMGHVTLITPIWGQSVILRKMFDMDYLCTKFDNSRFTENVK